MGQDLTMPMVWKLLIAALLGGIVGLEREFRRKPAGLRTNMFICMGSALFTILSDEFGSRFGGDHARIAAQLIPGIGFIGAGAIIRDRGSVVGLTTAATIFVVASVGMAVGSGMYYTGVFVALVVLLTLSLLGWMEDRLSLKTRVVTLRLTTTNLDNVMSPAHKTINEMGIPIQHFQLHHIGNEFLIEFICDVSYSQQQQALEKLGKLDARVEVVAADWQKE